MSAGLSFFKTPTKRAILGSGTVLRSVLGLVVVTLVAGTVATVAQTYRFSKVEIDGNQRVGDAAILQTAGIARGQTVSAGQVNDALQKLQNSGLFESVTVEPLGNTLVIKVVELPTINRVSFEGNRRIKDDVLAPLVQSQERRVYSPSQAQRDASVLAEAYASQGRLAARVIPRIISRSDNRVDLVFEIFEGDVSEIERLSFVGNRVFSDRALRRVLETKQAGFLRAFITRDTFAEDRIEFDKQVLRDFYLSRGYVDFRTNSVNAELLPNKDGFFLVFNVQEGQQFNFGEITVTSELDDVDADEFLAATRSQTGKTYAPTRVENDIARMERLAAEKLIDFLRIEPRITRNDAELTLDVEYVLSRGPRVFVERIDIEGNTTTLDRVIRQQFKSAEGDPFNPREIRESAERVRALDYFENVDVNAREGSSPDQVVVDVDVEEAPTGSFTIGGSFSSNDGFGLALQFAESNFMGRGQKLSISVSTAEESQNASITFVEPKLLGRDLEFGLTASLMTTESSFFTYNSEDLIFQPGIAFPVSGNGRFGLRYRYEEVEMTADGDKPGAVLRNEISRGKLSSSSIGYTYTYDTRRSGLNTDAGMLFELSQDFGGLGGDNEYLKSTAKWIGQRKLHNRDITLRATLEAGALNWSNGTSRTDDRFVLNPEIIRGFEPGGIGPRDRSLNAAGNAADDPLGGNLYYAVRFDAEFPLGLPEEYGIRGGAFYDIGNLWDLSDVDLSGGNIVGENGSARHVIGVSILWDTPIGPLRFNFSEALKKETYDREQSFDFTITTRF